MHLYLFPYQNWLHSLAKKIIEGFSPGVFNRLCVTDNKCSNSGNLELKSELIMFFFFKVELKALKA